MIKLDRFQARYFVRALRIIRNGHLHEKLVIKRGKSTPVNRPQACENYLAQMTHCQNRQTFSFEWWEATGSYKSAKSSQNLGQLVAI